MQKWVLKQFSGEVGILISVLLLTITLIYVIGLQQSIIERNYIRNYINVCVERDSMTVCEGIEYARLNLRLDDELLQSAIKIYPDTCP